jgi:hypothetical protein
MGTNYKHLSREERTTIQLRLEQAPCANMTCATFVRKISE